MSQRKFTVYTYDNEIAGLKSLVSLKKDIETGGDLFGLWLDDDELVIQIIGGPGQNCKRTVTSFHQDVPYLENVGTYLTTAEGLCNVGEWHSHHRLGLARPSFGDEQTVWSNMPLLGLTKFVLFIANITGSKKGKSEVNIGCFLFDKASNQVISGEFKYLAEKRSPLRGKREVVDVLKSGAELASSADIEQQLTNSSGRRGKRNKRKKGKAAVQAENSEDDEKTSRAKSDEEQNQQIPAKQARRTRGGRGPYVKRTGEVDSKENEKRVQKDEKDGNFNGAKESEKEELQANVNNEIDKKNSKLVGGNRNAEELKRKLKTNSEKKEDRSDEHGKNSVLKEGKKTRKPEEIGTAKKVGKPEPGENRKKDEIEEEKMKNGREGQDGNSKVNKDGDKEDEEEKSEEVGMAAKDEKKEMKKEAKEKVKKNVDDDEMEKVIDKIKESDDAPDEHAEAEEGLATENEKIVNEEENKQGAAKGGYKIKKQGPRKKKGKPISNRKKKNRSISY